MRIFFYTALFILFCGVARGQEVMSLEKAIALGLQNNYGLKIAELDIRIADNNNKWAIAGRAPTIDLNGFVLNNLVKDNNEASFLQGTYNNGSAGASIDLNWVLLNGGRVRISKTQLGVFADQSKVNKQAQLNSLIRDISLAYHEVLLQQAQLEVLQQSLDLSRRQLDYEEARKEFGSGNAYNLLQFESALLSDSTNIVMQNMLFDNSVTNLFSTLNLRDNSVYIFSDELSTELEEIDESALRKELFGSNPDILNLEVLSIISELNKKLEKAAWKPTISLNASGGRSEGAFRFFADDLVTGEPLDWIYSTRYTGTLGANFNWRLLDGGVRNTNIQNAQIQEDISRMTLEEARTALGYQLEILIGNYNYQKELLTLSNKQLEIAKRNQDMTEERFKSGVLNSLDFRNIQIQYLLAAFNKLNAIYNLIVTKAELDSLVGKYGIE